MKIFMQRLFRNYRFVNKLWAIWFCYFWLPCPICGKMFGGHETATCGINTESPQSIEGRITKDGKDIGTMTGLMQMGKCVCWRCGDAAKRLNNEFDEMLWKMN